MIGTHVDDVYDEFIQEAHLQAHAAVPENDTQKSAEKKRQNPFTLLMSTIASIFLPMLGVFSGAGIMRALLMAVSQLGFVSAESQTYQLIYMFSDAVFYFMPVFAAYCAAKRFKCNEFIAVALAALMIHPTFLAMVSAGESVKFFGVLPVQLVNYASQFIPILLVVYVQSWIEKYVKKWCPKVIAIFTVPLATIFITGILALTIVGPLGNLIGQAVAGGLTWLDSVLPWICPLVMGTFFPLIVLTGTHGSLMMAQGMQFMSVGYGTIYHPGAFSSNIATSGAALAVALRSKNPDTKSAAASAAISAICGITEPALYGISVRLRTPLYATMIGGGCAGLFAGLFGVKIYAMSGTNIFSLPIYIGQGYNFIFAIIMLLIAFVVAFVVSFVTYRPASEQNAAGVLGNSEAAKMFTNS